MSCARDSWGRSDPLAALKCPAGAAVSACLQNKHRPQLSSERKANCCLAPPQIKKPAFAGCFIGGGQTRTDGDRSRGIYSPLQLPLCDTPERKETKVMLAKGLEPSTVRLQGGCSTIELHQH
jgi:hypothetical protein